MNDAVVIGGLGVVGKATREMFGIPYYFDLKGSNITLKEAVQKKFIFLTLPTPAKLEDGYETDLLYDMVSQLTQYGGGILINRSTVIPGTADAIMDKFNIDSIVSNPEFLTMSTIPSDIDNPDLVVLGGRNRNMVEAVEKLYQGRYSQPYKHSRPHFFLGTNKEAEMIKLAINVFYATKVVFANELYDICELEGIDYNLVYQTMYKRKWIGNNHLRVINQDKTRGAKGACLEKDLHSFATHYNRPLTLLADKINKSL